MAAIQYKRILLVFFFILCFISIQARARALKERSNVGNSSNVHNKEEHDVKFKPKEDDEGKKGEVFSMDYTPARRKPPIHN
ncbi:hypothetical protein TanjilG_31307 [Lupinus angustifolius]|uniref:Uncharacterized protein n=1 Tax=Lupinus angustifolius TaxID=3871 RepID=A0A4P1RTQ4_LUPAN|nr:PREDICTED: uncharacterized protein LOC109342912 [Lupinus angustifolius]OIW18187.1 hypothetical protein TanjilG_31307 [Lupinus angustifolius]